MLKQRNLLVRPGNEENAKLEMDKLEHFGWTRVLDKTNPDGTMIISYARDDEEQAELAERETRYRSAKLAEEFAGCANERLTELKGQKKSKLGLVLTIIFAVLAVAFVALTVVALVLDRSVYKAIFGQGVTFAGDWQFLGAPMFSLNKELLQVKLLAVVILAPFALLFLSLAFFFLRKNLANKLDSLDYASFAFQEATYYDEVKETAAREAAELYPEG